MKKLICVLLAMLLLCSGAMASAVINSVDIYVDFNGDSNVRTGPGLSYAGIDVAKKDSVRTYLFDSAVDDRGVIWYCVGDGDTTGWVSSKYTQLRDFDGYLLEATAGDMIPVVFDTVTIYSKPYEAYDFMLTSVSQDNAGQIEYLGLIYEGLDETWYCVRYGWCEGWVSDSCMELQYD